MFTFLCFVCVLLGVSGREFLDEEYSKLPVLFQLDDYDECLSKEDGIYCLATLELKPTHAPNPTYQLMKEYSEEVYTFNRTLIHRGYCLSACCPLSNNDTRTNNITVRLENCADKLASNDGMCTVLHTLHYCRTYGEAHATFYPDLPQLIYLVVVVLILILNISGTAYDVMTGDNPKKINLLMGWSVLKNWKQFKQPNKSSTHASLAALQGIRVAVAICFCLAHSGLIYYTLYLYDPRSLEQITRNPVTMLLQNSTSMEQMFVVLSSFLCVYSLKQSSKKLSFSFGLLVKLLAKRIFRISPLYLLVLGFAATWWPLVNDGPLWPAMVAAESRVCRDKFLSHAMFVNNLVEPERICLLPTWYLAVDIQMYIITVTLTLGLSRLRTGRITILLIFLLGSIILNAALAYKFDWKPMLYFTGVTENLRTLLRDIPSFSHLYMSPWGNLPACFVGLIIGHLYQAIVDTNFDADKYKWILYPTYFISIPALTGWLLIGYFLQYIDNKPFMAFHAAAERSLFQILCLLIYIVLSAMNSFIIRLFAWRGWQVLARLSLSVMLMHWCVNMMLVAPNPQPVPASALYIITIGTVTACFTYILAVPMILLVEMPVKNSFDIVSST